METFDSLGLKTKHSKAPVRCLNEASSVDTVVSAAWLHVLCGVSLASHKKLAEIIQVMCDYSGHD